METIGINADSQRFSDSPMPKEWILNSAMNRFQLNFKRNVGPTSEEIRKCAPKSKENWANYYYSKVKSREHIDSLGRKLYAKISEVLAAEIDDISLEDCVHYMHQLVIDRTFDGYTTEISTIYGQLQDLLSVRIEPAPDKWDRLYNVDFFITIGNHHIGLQVKPAPSLSQIPQIFKEQSIQEATHIKFTREYGGKVFYVVSIKKDRKKVIHNLEVVDEIRAEIQRLRDM